MAKKEPIDVDKFFTDPATAEEADFFRKAVNYLVDERVKEAQKNAPAENKGILDQIFGSLIGEKK